MPPQLDHIMWAGADLDRACSLFEHKTGVRPEPGGVHPQFGTHNRLTRLGDREYFEIIAPNHARLVKGTFGEQFLSLAEPRINAVIFGRGELETLQEIYRKAGEIAEIVEGSRMTPEGKLVRWRMLVPQSSPFSDWVPRFIDWLNTPHPCTILGGSCSLLSLGVSHPHADALGKVWRALGIDMTPVNGPSAFSASLETPRGIASF